MIKIYTLNDFPQGSPEWHKIRKGLITGTDAYSLLHGKPITQILKAKAQNNFQGNYWTRRGHILEDEAKEIYSQLYSPTEDVGFVTNSKYPKAGVSPDGMVGKNGLVECKAFKEKRHFSVYKNLDAHILDQIQFQLFITERDWCDLLLYNPDVEDPSKAFLKKRILPDETIFKQLTALLT